ncbi:MAG: 5-oxoprolinase subunit PxpB [Ostreibacterium sp.]
MSLTAVPAGDKAIIFYLPEPIGDDYPLILEQLSVVAKKAGALDVVPAYHSLLVVFSSHRFDTDALLTLLQKTLLQIKSPAATRKKQPLVRIPVCYAAEFATDLPEVAHYTQLTLDEVITRHHGRRYMVCCLGFIPGFAFLGHVDNTIAVPRHAKPRAHVIAGSVGIAGRQTGIYPNDSPGGWQIIGRTTKTLYDPEKGLISCFELGDAVEFYPISREEFNQWSAD